MILHFGEFFPGRSLKAGVMGKKVKSEQWRAITAVQVRHSKALNSWIGNGAGDDRWREMEKMDLLKDGLPGQDEGERGGKHGAQISGLDNWMKKEGIHWDGGRRKRSMSESRERDNDIHSRHNQVWDVCGTIVWKRITIVKGAGSCQQYKQI